MASIVLSKKNFNHPWIYKSLIRQVLGSPATGDLVDVLSNTKHFLGKAYYNPASEITARVLSRENCTIDETFFGEKMRNALSLRERFVHQTNAYRVISSEGDDLPGLIVDRYGDVLVFQILTLGMERMKEMIIRSLEALGNFKGIYEKSDSGSRLLEGMQKRSGWVRKDCGAEIDVYENNITYRIHLEQGHKTGMYLDQRENRLLFPEMAGKGQVLDAFCYTGGFGLHLAAKGSKVIALDSSAEALAQAAENRRLSGIEADAIEFREENVFDALKNFDREKRKFDFVILDPPSFVKRKRELAGAIAGFNEIILRSLKILNPGGLLAVFSCSYHVDENLLMQVILNASSDARRQLKVLRFLRQAADHPINPLIPETYYLKGYLLLVI